MLSRPSAIGPDGPCNAQNARTKLRAEISSIHGTGMVIEEKDLSGLKCAAALPCGQGAAGTRCFKGVDDVRSIDEYPHPAPANLVALYT